MSPSFASNQMTSPRVHNPAASDFVTCLSSPLRAVMNNNVTCLSLSLFLPEDSIIKERASSTLCLQEPLSLHYQLLFC